MWSVWGRSEGCTGCWWGNLRERGHWRDPDADGRIIITMDRGDWMELAQDRDGWRALVSTVKNFRVP
jgi:hypothetical protein